jgi:hypothetical protein
MDMPESVHRKVSMLAAKTERKKVNQSANVVGGWIERGGVGVKILFLLCDRCTPRVAIAYHFAKKIKDAIGWNLPPWLPPLMEIWVM